MDKIDKFELLDACDAIARHLHVAAVKCMPSGVVLYHQTDAEDETGWKTVPPCVMQKEGITHGSLTIAENDKHVRMATPDEHVRSLLATGRDGGNGFIEVVVDGKPTKCYVYTM